MSLPGAQVHCPVSQNSAPSAEETGSYLVPFTVGEGGDGAQLPRRRDGEARAGPPRGPRGWG